jgi:hypothetical protein
MAKRVKKEKNMTRNKARIIAASMLAMGVLVFCALPLAAQEDNTYIQHAQRSAISPPLRELAKLPPPPQYILYEVEPIYRPPKRALGHVVDTVEQSSMASLGANYTIGVNFLGQTDAQEHHLRHAADTNMAVGDTQIVQWVNTIYEVTDKSGNVKAGPFPGNQIFANLGGPCATHNDGDPIAQWDNINHRWVLSQPDFNYENGGVPPYNICLAVSTSSDATGSYYLYQFPVVNNGFPDYPKWGIWTVNYGQTWNNLGPGGSGFVGPVFCAYNNAKLIVGDNTAEQICHQYGISPNFQDTLLPADLDSPTLPPAGEDQFAIGSLADIDNSHLSLYSVHINNPSDWSQGATFTGDNGSQLLTVAPYNPTCGGTEGVCVPQKGVSDQLDSLGWATMYRFAYWEDPPLANVRATPPKPAHSQHWLANFSVTASGGQTGVRWMEITAPIKVVQPTALSVF